MVDDPFVKAIPLGGLGQVGGNLMVYETERDMIVVDCGMLFPSLNQHGVDCLIPNINYIIERSEKLRGVIITHGHEDHIGALPLLAQYFPVPIYATGFTLALIKYKFERADAETPQLRQLFDGESVTVGEFEIEPIPVTHSIPDAVSLSITTPVGILLHTGDFKVDPHPVDGRLCGEARFRTLGEEGITALLSDSTNSEQEGWSWSEQKVANAIEEVIAKAPERVLVTTFSSHIHRIQTIISLSEKHGRRVMPVGRSMANNISISKRLGYLKVEPGTLIEPNDFEIMPRDEVTIIASGCQGEPRSALYRIADQSHPHVVLAPEDIVIMSSRRIPGNELSVSTMIDAFVRQGVDVITDKSTPIHTSGHGYQEEQKEMLSWCKPKTFIPVHGTPRHLLRHAALAEETGVLRENIRIVENGIPIVITQFPDELVIRADEPVECGYICIDGLAEVNEVILKDRRLLAEFGIVVCTVVIDSSGKLISAPSISTRGVIHVDQSADFMEICETKVAQRLEQMTNKDDVDREAAIRQTIRKLFKSQYKRRPLVIPAIMTSQA